MVRHKTVEIILKASNTVKIHRRASAVIKQLLFVIHMMLMKKCNCLTGAYASLYNGKILVHDPVHLRLYLINKFLIQRHRSFHCKIIAAAYRIMDHYTVYIFLPCHIINCFQKNQTCTSAISFVSDRIFGCHKFNLTVCLEMLMQFSQPAIYDHQHYRCIRTSFVFLYNLTVRNLLRILFCYSLYRNVIHFLSHKSCLHFCYTDK